MARRDVLEAIRWRDPDGGATQPTDEDRAAFRRWVILTYGLDTWVAYVDPGWDEAQR